MRDSLEMFSNRYGKNYIVAAEVGAGRGLNAREMIEGINFSKLYLVEPYTCQSLNGFPEFCELIEDKSVPASKRIPNDSLDFVYIDGDHSYEAVRDDIESWFSKVKHGGWMLFHDYDKSREDVYRAANEFASSRGLTVIEFMNQAQTECAFQRI